MASGGNTHGSAFIICTKHSQLSWTFLPVNTHSRAGTQRKNLLKISNEPLKVICFMFMTSTLSSWPGQTLRWYHRVNVNLQQITCKKIGLIWLTQMPQERAGTGALLQGSKPRNSILCHFLSLLHLQSSYNLRESLPYKSMWNLSAQIFTDHKVSHPLNYLVPHSLVPCFSGITWNRLPSGTHWPDSPSSQRKELYLVPDSIFVF